MLNNSHNLPAYTQETEEKEITIPTKTKSNGYTVESTRVEANDLEHRLIKLLKYLNLAEDWTAEIIAPAYLYNYCKKSSPKEIELAT